MKIYNLKEIRSTLPCYDPTTYLPEDWTGTAIDILNTNKCPLKDRIWVICHQLFLTDKKLRTFAVWCVEKTLKTRGYENTEEAQAAREAAGVAGTAEWAAGTASLAAAIAAGAAGRLAGRVAWEAASSAARIAAGAAAEEVVWEAQRQYLIELFLNK